MRKIKLQMQITLDGFVCGPKGEMEWMIWDWDDILKQYVTELTNTADSFIVGRKTAEGMSVYWPTVAGNPQSSEEDKSTAVWMNESPKIVFSTTLSSIYWTNAQVSADIVSEVEQLKKEPGKDILIYGGAGMVSSFIQHRLIDEYHLFVNPVAIGKGKPIFQNLEDQLKFKLVKATISNSGIVVLCYQPLYSYQFIRLNK